MLELKKGDKVIYIGNMPFKLGNGQQVENHNEELTITSDVLAQKEFFRLVPKPVEKTVEKVEESKKQTGKK